MFVELYCGLEGLSIILSVIVSFSTVSSSGSVMFVCSLAPPRSLGLNAKILSIIRLGKGVAYTLSAEDHRVSIFDWNGISKVRNFGFGLAGPARILRVFLTLRTFVGLALPKTQSCTSHLDRATGFCDP